MPKEPVTLTLDGKTFTLAYTLDDLETVEEMLGTPILKLEDSGIKAVRTCFYAAVRGQHGVQDYDDAAGLVTLENYRQVDEACGEALARALTQMYGAKQALETTPVGES